MNESIVKPENDSSSSSPKSLSRYGFAAFVTLVFLIIAGWAALNHEFWRDEMQAWLIARDTPSLTALFEQAHYEGAPPLWSVMLRALTLITTRPEVVQVLTWVLGGCTVFVMAAFSPFSRLQKILLIGNYYFLFEYGTVCRNYLPGILGLMTACALYPLAKKKPWFFVLALMVPVMASVHSLIVAVALAAAFWSGLLWDKWCARRSPEAAAMTLHRGPLALVIIGLVAAVLLMAPRPDTLYGPADGWSLGWNPERLGKIACAFVWSHFPMPRPPGFFWIPPWDTPEPSFDPAVMFFLAASLFAGGAFFFRKNVDALMCYFVGSLGVLAFLYTKYLGFPRHTGFFFITLLCALWIKRVAVSDRSSSIGSVWIERAAGLVFTVMLAFQAVSGLAAVHEDSRRPFSCGKPAAELILQKGLGGAFIAVGPDWAGSPLAGYLDRQVYYPQGSRYGSFTRWDHQRNEELTDTVFLQRALQEAAGRETVLVSDHPFPENLMQQYGVSVLGHVGGSLTPFEDYYLFYVPPLN
jgi:hypothetical protein